MKRALFLALMGLVALGIVAGATAWRNAQPAAEPVAVGLWPTATAARQTPTGQLVSPVGVPSPAAATAMVNHPFFPLTAGHAGHTCAACHTANQFIGLDNSCYACHAADDVHLGDNGPDCAQCHTPTLWSAATFDHAFIGTRDCADCHQPPANHFPGACRSCHVDTTNFAKATFTHRFPLDHGGANGRCLTCHVDNVTPQYTCTACHDQPEMVEEHADKDIFDITRCVACHADGQKDDD